MVGTHYSNAMHGTGITFHRISKFPYISLREPL